MQKLKSDIPMVVFWAAPALFLFIFLSGCGGPYGPAAGGFVDEQLFKTADRIVRQGLRDADPRIRANAAEVVGTTGRVKFMPQVGRLLRDEFVPVRYAALLAVADTKYMIGQPSIRNLLTDADNNVRIAAAYCLGRLVDKSYFALVRQAIADTDQTVRANAAVLLGKTGDKAVLGPLYEAMRAADSDDKVRFQAAEAVARLGDESIYPRLWAILISAYADDRVMGVRAMGALGTTQAKNALITMLDDDVLEVRLAAAEQLGSLGDVSGEPEVLDVFKKKLTGELDREGRERVMVLVSLAIGQIRTPRLLSLLTGLLEEDSKLVALAAAKAVYQSEQGSRQSSKNLPVLRRLSVLPGR